MLWAVLWQYLPNIFRSRQKKQQEHQANRLKVARLQELNKWSNEKNVAASEELFA